MGEGHMEEHPHQATHISQEGHHQLIDTLNKEACQLLKETIR